MWMVCICVNFIFGYIDYKIFKWMVEKNLYDNIFKIIYVDVNKCLIVFYVFYCIFS